MKALLLHTARSFIDWFFRRRSASLNLVRTGAVLIGLVLAGMTFSIQVPTPAGPVTLSLETGTPFLIGCGVLIVAAGLMIFGFISWRSEQKQIDRKRVVVVEVRGLRDTSGSPLSEAVPEKIVGRREPILIDLRQRLKDGFIVEPEVAIERLLSMETASRLRGDGADRRDVSYVYGGLAPVPLTFLSGVLFDDEGQLTVMDWDRHTSAWRSLSDEDDGKRLLVSGLDAVTPNTPEVALAISISYGVDLAGVRSKVGALPVVQMTLPGGTPDCHWSEEKQSALGQQFLDAVIAIGNLGVGKIHLFLAAQNSVVFRLGRLYDRRNLPRIAVYQYQREESPPYPWGVAMPVGGASKPEVVA